jgi:Short C-terminal domain
MYISRGFNKAGEEGAPEGAEPPPPQTLEYLLMHDRITSLERLARLREGGTLTDEEFAAEKERILQLPSEELVLRTTRPARPKGPSLMGRLFGWKLLALAVLLGLGLACFTQPQETMRMLERTFGL